MMWYNSNLLKNFYQLLFLCVKLINNNGVFEVVNNLLPNIWWQCTIKINGAKEEVMQIGTVERYSAIDGAALPGEYTKLLFKWSENQLMPELDKSENVLFVNGHKAIGDTPIYSHDVVEVRTHDSIEQEKKAKKQAFYDAVKSHKDMENSKKEKNVASEETKSDIEAVNVFKNMIEHESKEEHTLEKDIKTDENIVDADSNCDNEKMSEDLLVIVNKKPVFLKGKDKYMFVDIFDYIINPTPLQDNKTLNITKKKAM